MEKKYFGYLDKGDILHIVKDKNTAKEHSKNGKVVETEVYAEHGYPVVENKTIIVYTETYLWIEDKGYCYLDDLSVNEVNKYKPIFDLYRLCK